MYGIIVLMHCCNTIFVVLVLNANIVKENNGQFIYLKFRAKVYSGKEIIHSQSSFGAIMKSDDGEIVRVGVLIFGGEIALVFAFYYI